MKFFDGIILAFLACCFVSCSDNEPHTPTELETQPISRIHNDDGSYYVLHEGYLTLRRADDSQIKRIYFESPAPVKMQLGYGQERVWYYEPNCFGLMNDNVAVGYSIVYNNMGNYIFSGGPGYIFQFDKELSKVNRLEVDNGFLTIGDNMLISVNQHFGFTLYDSSLNIIKYASDFEGVEYSPIGRRLLSEIKGKYYLLCSVRRIGSGSSDAIVNLSDEIACDIELPAPDEIINDILPNEINEPLFEGKSFEAGDNGFYVTYTYKLFDGSTKEVSFAIETDGSIINQ